MSALARELAARGFRVTPSRRNAGGIHVRVRDNEADAAEVARIVASVAPDATEGPYGTPTQTIVGYREG